MEETSNLALPYILPSQAQKHVTHNEALRRLDALVQLAVISRNLTAPPASPGEGDRYIVGGPATGAWAGQEKAIAAWQDGVWTFYEPGDGWLSVVLSDDALCFWDGTDWQDVQGGSIGSVLDGVSVQNAPMTGIGTEADTTNNFAAKLNNALWTARTVSEGGTGDLRYKMNKESALRTLSLLMQTNYSGRAELGLNGSDDFSLKVSGDGSVWHEALSVERTSGRVRLPASNLLSDHCLNLLGDSGRFSSNGLNTIAVGSFSFPAYLTAYNSATVSNLGKFINNNTDYGGTGGAMNSSVRALIDKIRDAGNRRYGVEFWVAQLTHGSGTAMPLSHQSQTWYLSLFTTQTMRAPNVTFHAYVRAIDADILVYRNAGQTIRVEGTDRQTHTVIQPSDGWVSVAIQDMTPLRTSTSYSPMVFNLYAKSSGHRYHIACPVLMSGIISVNPDSGVTPAVGSWPA